jgi:membrane fusion protein, multidrug efflux system
MKRNLLFCRNCLFACLIVAVFAGCNKKENVEGKPPEVVVAKVRSQKITESTTIVGGVVAKNEVYLRARVIGFLEKRNFREGAVVKKGDLLFQIEKTKYQAEVESARAQLETAEANLKKNLIDFDRQKYLVNKDAVAKMNYDLAECEKTKSEADVLAGKAALKEAKLKLSYTDIYAPFTGRIGKSKYSVGNLVSPNSEPLALLTMVNPITAEFNISESLLVTLLQYAEKEEKDGKDKKHNKLDIDFVTVKLILANGTDYPVEGKIDFVDNVINPMTGTILVRAEFENSNSILTPGAYVNVVIESQYKKERLLIPQASIQEDQTGQFVMMLNKKDIIVKKTIKTGSIYGTEVVVLEGLKLDDKVIKEGLQKVRAGMQVTPTDDIFAQTHSASTSSPEVEKTNQSKNKDEKIEKNISTEKSSKKADVTKKEGNK